VRWHCRLGRDEFRITGTGGVMDLTPLNGPSLRYGETVEMIPPHQNIHYPCVENFVAHVLDGAPLRASGQTSVWTDWVTSLAVAGAGLQPGASFISS
jgi:hypothetical protein